MHSIDDRQGAGAEFLVGGTASMSSPAGAAIMSDNVKQHDVSDLYNFLHPRKPPELVPWDSLPMTQRDSIQIHLVDVERIIDLRWRLLRAGLSRETAYFD